MTCSLLHEGSMTQHNDTVGLRHMRDHAAEAVALASDRQRRDLDEDRIFALALTKLVEIVGEAAARVPEVTRSAHLEIPWRQIIGTRNRLIHGYDAVDFNILWRIVDHELPLLVGQLEALLEELSSPTQ